MNLTKNHFIRIFIIIIASLILKSNIKSQSFTNVAFDDTADVGSTELIDTSQLNTKEGIYWERTAISGGIVAAFNVAAWNYYLKTWYFKTSDKFLFRDDWYDHSLNVDKFGHFYTTTLTHKTIYKLCQWSNFSETQSLLTSSILSWLMMFPIEIKDGFYTTYGFSWSDLGANTLGAIYPSLQKIYEPLNAVNLKMSMHTSDNWGKVRQIRNVVDDYEGRTFWISIDINELLPENKRDYWFQWLGIAIGYGGSEMFIPYGSWNIDGNLKGRGNQEWYIALDYNLMKIFKPEPNTFLFHVLDILNMIHLPAPTIRFTPHAVLYGFYF